MKIKNVTKMHFTPVLKVTKGNQKAVGFISVSVPCEQSAQLRQLQLLRVYGGYSFLPGLNQSLFFFFLCGQVLQAKPDPSTDRMIGFAD